MAEPQTPQIDFTQPPPLIDFTQPPPLIDFTQPPPGLGMAGGSLSNPASVPNARIRNLPNPAANETSPLSALYHGAKTGATLGMLPAAAAAIPTTIPAAIGTATGIAGGAAAGVGAKAGAEALGVGELGQEAAGDVGSVVGGILGAGFGEAGAKIGQRIYNALPKELQQEVLGLISPRIMHGAKLIKAASKMLPEAAEATTPQAPASTVAPKAATPSLQGLVDNAPETAGRLNNSIPAREGFVYRAVTGKEYQDVLRTGQLKPGSAADTGGTVNFSKEPISLYAASATKGNHGLVVEVPESALKDPRFYEGSKDVYAESQPLPISKASKIYGVEIGPKGWKVADFTNRPEFTAAAPSGQITPQGQNYLGQLQQIARQIEAQEGRSTPKNVTPSRAAALKKPLTPAASSDDLTNLLQESVKRAKAAKGTLADLR